MSCKAHGELINEHRRLDLQAQIAPEQVWTTGWVDLEEITKIQLLLDFPRISTLETFDSGEKTPGLGRIQATLAVTQKSTKLNQKAHAVVRPRKILGDIGLGQLGPFRDRLICPESDLIVRGGANGPREVPIARMIESTPFQINPSTFGGSDSECNQRKEEQIAVNKLYNN